MNAAPRFIVRCEDGRIRHLNDPYVDGGSFTNRADAAKWADTGHACLAKHTIERIVPAGSAGCIVLPGIDGPTLWDCSCTSCVENQQYGEDDFVPTCSICDGAGHGYPGAGPCPLEVTDYSGEPWWAQ